MNRGTDASDLHDEELPPEDQDFSDDEAEAAARAARKRAAKASRGGGQDGDNGLRYDGNKAPPQGGRGRMGGYGGRGGGGRDNMFGRRGARRGGGRGGGESLGRLVFTPFPHPLLAMAHLISYSPVFHDVLW